MMPFGLSNAPANFQSYIIKILVEHSDVFIIIYLNDILISTNKSDYVDFVWWVLDKLQKYFLYTKLKKYQFHQEEMQFFGYMVSSQGTCMKNEWIKAICN